MDPANSSRVLLVEGSSDMHVVIHLLQRHGLEPNFEIADKQGFPALRKSIYGEVNVSGRQALGILADANDDVTGRWQAISGRLAKAGCAVPKTPARAGSVFPGPRDMRVGVWLMPDNQGSGELEDFVHDLIPATDPVLPRARRYIDGIPAGERKFEKRKLTRAYVHAWLATRKEPRPMGTAIRTGDLLHDAGAASSFVNWLLRLFGP